MSERAKSHVACIKMRGRWDLVRDLSNMVFYALWGAMLSGYRQPIVWAVIPILALRWFIVDRRYNHWRLLVEDFEEASRDAYRGLHKKTCIALAILERADRSPVPLPIDAEIVGWADIVTKKHREIGELLITEIGGISELVLEDGEAPETKTISIR